MTKKKRKKKKITKAVLQKRQNRLRKKEFREKLKHWRAGVIERDRGLCQKCLKSITIKNVHHIIALQSIKRNYPSLLEDINNGILLCSFCHKYAPDSPHQGSLEFMLWLQEHKSYQYYYLINKLKELNNANNT